MGLASQIRCLFPRHLGQNSFEFKNYFRNGADCGEGEGVKNLMGPVAWVAVIYRSGVPRAPVPRLYWQMSMLPAADAWLPNGRKPTTFPVVSDGFVSPATGAASAASD
jgi:hypothetical protein